MFTTDHSTLPLSTIRSLTTAIGIVAVIGFIAIILFFTVGGFWGPLNDLSIAAEALLTAALAWMLHPIFSSQSPRLSNVMLTVAILGSLIASIGSAFVIFSITGYFLVETPWGDLNVRIQDPEGLQVTLFQSKK